MSDENKNPQTIIEAIQRDIGERAIFTGGRDFHIPSARVVCSPFEQSEDHEKALLITQGKDHKITITLNTLEAIVKWAKENNVQAA